MNTKNKKIGFLKITVVLCALLFLINVASAAVDICPTKRAGDACVMADGASGSCSAAKVCVAINDNQCGTPRRSGDACIMNDGSTGACKSNGTKLACYQIASSSAEASNSVSALTNSTNFTNPLQFTTVEEFLGGILSAIQKIIVVLALVFIMIGSVMILASAGNSAMVEKGKGAITMALIGLALGIAAPSLLKELSALIGWGVTGDVAAALTLSQIAVNVLNFLLGTMGILALIMLVIGGIMYLTSAGDEDRVNKGKEIFKYSLLGLGLAMSAMVLVTQIAKFFQ